MSKFKNTDQATEHIDLLLNSGDNKITPFMVEAYETIKLFLRRGGMYQKPEGQHLIVEALERLLQDAYGYEVDDSKHKYKHLIDLKGVSK